MSKDDKVSFLFDDNSRWSVSDMIKHALNEYESGITEANSAVLLTLNTYEDNYRWKMYTSNLKDSELVALFEIVKSWIVDNMNEE